MLKASDPAYLRLVEEKAVLEKKVEHLESFVRAARRGEAPEDAELTTSEIELLEEQLHYMRGYLRTINCRISNVRS